MSNPVRIKWAHDGHNASSFDVGVRLTTAPNSQPGAYPYVQSVSNEARSVNLAQFSPPLVPGEYAASVRAIGPLPSEWGPEFAFKILAKPATPSAIAVE